MKNCDLFIGRFQPFHKGHEHTIRLMDNPVVVVVSGKASSEDLERNPLNFEIQKSLIEQACPDVPVFPFTNGGFVPAIIEMVQEHGYIVKRVFAGMDRLDSYRGQVMRANKKVELGVSTHHLLDVEFIGTPRITSASVVRDTIRNGKFNEFVELMPLGLANFHIFKQLQQVLKVPI